MHAATAVIACAGGDPLTPQTAVKTGCSTVAEHDSLVVEEATQLP